MKMSIKNLCFVRHLRCFVGCTIICISICMSYCINIIAIFVQIYKFFSSVQQISRFETLII